MNLKKLTSSFLAILAVVTLSVFNISCSDTETTDSTGFAIYYTGMTDIGPSMVGTISSPTYKGAAPSDFAITGITLNGEPYSGDCFEIDPETGKISISNTKNASTGRYSISISCMAGGKSYSFPGIVTVKMLAAAPEGITMTPNLLTVDYGDVIDINSIVDMPTSIVSTEGEHISITKYEIGAVELVTNNESDSEPLYQPLGEEYKKCFSISNEGAFTIVQGSDSEILEPAIYSVSLILGTKVGDSMLERAIQVKITSKPLALTYAKGYGKIEEKTTADPTSFTSETPTFKGSTDELKFSIHSITPTTDKIKINEKTGQIYVEDGHGFKIGEIYTISVSVKNAFNTEEEKGKIFNDIYTLETVDFIKPITKFFYGENNSIKKVELARYNVAPNIEGDEVLYKFTNIPAELANTGVAFNENDGSITAIKGNKVPKGIYRFTVTAINPKGEMLAEVTLNIIENPNKFTYIHYGNNLGEDGTELKGDEYQNQFRFTKKVDFQNSNPVPVTDFKGKNEDLKWTVAKVHQIGAKDVTSNGSFTLTSWKDSQIGIVMVTATAGNDPDTQVTVSTPLFIHCCTPTTNGYTIEYSPMVLRVNPKVGGQSNIPAIKKNGTILTDEERATFLLDYRRTFNYYNNGGKRSDGTEHESGRPIANGSKFMQNLWNKFDGGNESKLPVSYFQNQTIIPKTDWTKTLAYVDNGADLSKRHSVAVLANQWNDDGWANGFFHGQMTCTTEQDKDKLNDGEQIFPFVIWLDENYEKQ
ncbi:surface glycan-binding family protein [Bacteroides zhangwenhongii]|uniref:surface glycan-binding family protein n=1 Tax=Bacteroides zhangwenhongii TaxID=2650157 RepID=UPI003AB0A3EB